MSRRGPSRQAGLGSPRQELSFDDQRLFLVQLAKKLRLDELPVSDFVSHGERTVGVESLPDLFLQVGLGETGRAEIMLERLHVRPEDVVMHMPQVALERR